MSEVPAVPAGSLTDATSARLASDGPLARTLSGFEPRPSQREMAVAVAAVLTSGGVLLAEAGTGTGKTLAYLIPAILSRRRILVSTGTKNLQEQIFHKDLPLLQRTLGVPFTATYLKGRTNYLCRHRFEQFTAEGLLLPDDRVHFALVEDWAAHTETGDRAEIDELPDDISFWSDIAATSEQCLGTSCPQYQECFITRMRQRAAESDVVIVNHHLLCADAALRQHAFGEVIPECDVAIIDEAHQLEDVATQHFGVSISNYRLEEIVRDARRALVAPAHPGTSEADRVPAAERQRLAHALEEVDAGSRELFGALDRTRVGDRPGNPDRVRVTADSLASIHEPGYALAGALAALASGLGDVIDAPEELRAIAHRATELREQLAFLLKADNESFVYFLERRGRGVFLRAAPVDVSHIIRELLLDRMHATVLTSATLAVDGSFEYVRSRLGIDEAEALRLPSEFDYAQQATLYLPRGLPDPRSGAFAARAGDEVVEILRRTEGRAFVLFTSYATLRQVQARVATALPYPLFVQGTAPRSRLVEQFRATPNAVLLGTSSFWQGVDVVGEALSCVVIDKLPFASPADPITAARIDALRERGEDPFSTYQVPLAILTLLQGLGRLIRSRADRGVLAILDPRLRTMGYGRRFLDALPPAPVIHTLDDIARFLSQS
ncbi:MAG: DEAD/DEAH box helicase [Luteitalea sp.]|nr:DEAD/DEAH box helicase [Luteitalea sp.]